jgi:hypothetical protein
MGLIQGVGIDRLDGDTVLASGGGSVGTACGGIGQTQCTAPDGVYDYMSYCAPTNYTYPSIEPSTWISPQGWQELILSWEAGRPGSINDIVEPARASPGPSVNTALRRPQLVVDAVLLDGRAIITDLHTSSGPVRATGGSAYTLTARDSRGRVAARSAMSAVIVHDEHGPGTPALAFETLRGHLPAAATIASLEVSYRGRVQDRLRRPAHEPSVTLLAPRRGPIGKTRFVVIRWTPRISIRTRSDPRTRLTATIEYSANAGRNYRIVFSGPSTGRVRLPSNLFGASKNARIEVAVSDGFADRSASSGRLTAIGSAPRPRILQAPYLTRIASDGSVSFQGAAIDDEGRTLPSTALSWYLGIRLLGRGATLDGIQLPPGHDNVTLMARDQLGRAGFASVPVQVVAVAPSIVELVAPSRISTSARTLQLTIALRGPASLAIAKQRWAVGTRARTVAARLTPGRTPLRLALTLTTSGSTKTTTFVLQVARG